jgi:transposase
MVTITEKRWSMPKAFPEEFRRDVVAVARRREVPIVQIAKDFGISPSCVQRWLKRAEIEDGVREGRTLAEEAEIRELKKRNKLSSRRTRCCGAPPSTSEGTSSQNDVPAGP